MFPATLLETFVFKKDSLQRATTVTQDRAFFARSFLPTINEISELPPDLKLESDG